MLESASERLCERGGPHFGSPDKSPAARLETIRLAGERACRSPSGILIGNRRDAGASASSRCWPCAICTTRHGHIQEIIVQNFRAKPRHAMADAPEPAARRASVDDRHGAARSSAPEMNIQAPPNLSPQVLRAIDRRRNQRLGRRFAGDARSCQSGGALAAPRSPCRGHREGRQDPRGAPRHLSGLCTRAQALAGRDDSGPPSCARSMATGTAATDAWAAGEFNCAAGRRTVLDSASARSESGADGQDLAQSSKRAQTGKRLGESGYRDTVSARGARISRAVCPGGRRAPRSRSRGDAVSYVVTRNINYTNVCYFKCQFCAFSKGACRENLRGGPTISRWRRSQQRAGEGWERGATEVCMQGGIHPALHRENIWNPPGGEGGRAGNPCARVLAARGLAGSRHHRHARCGTIWSG